MSRYQHVYFIVDANSKIGFGHLKRCILLSEEFKIHNLECEFWFHNSSTKATDKIESKQIFQEKEDLVNYMLRSRFFPNSLIVLDTDDSYFYSEDLQQKMLDAKLRFMYISVKNVPYKSHYLFNQNLMALDEVYQVEDYTKTFLGPKYFVLEDNVAKILPIDPSHNDKKKLLVTFGTSDPYNITEKILDLLPEIIPIFDEINIVVGHLNKAYPKLDQHPNLLKHQDKTTLLFDVDDMYSLMAESTLALTSMGLTFWELTLHNIPSLVISASPREKPQATYFSDKKHCQLIGHFDDNNQENWGTLIKQSLGNKPSTNLLSKINTNGKSLLVEHLLKDIELNIARKEDYDAFYKIRSEKQNLYWTGYDTAPDYEKFSSWFDERLNDQTRYIYMAENAEGDIVGYLNFDIYEDYVAIGYAILAEYQGNGYATKIVNNAISIATGKTKRIIAWISEKNIASQKVAEKNGFKVAQSEVRKRHGVEEKYWRYDYTI